MAGKYLKFEQDGVEYNLYDMPKGFVIKGNVDLSHECLTELPDLSEVVVEGEFECSYNQLTNLKGAPQKVGGGFWCHQNELTTLNGAPREVGRHFCCDDNQLTTLKGAPQKIGGYVSCSNNRLTSLTGAPKEAERGFFCNNNQLTTLEGAPKTVGGDFICNNNQLITLKGAPHKISGDFYCPMNQLTSLLGIPQLQEDKKIKCDDALGEKYGFSDSQNRGFTFEGLIESTLYKSEVAAENVRRKQQIQERTEKQQQATENTKAAFDAWLKNKGIEPPAR